MKVFYICSKGFDYIQDLTYSGLVRTLGARSIRDYPWNKKYHLNFWSYPKNIGYRSDLLNLKNSLPVDQADVVIVASAKADAFYTLRKIISKIPRTSRLILLDGGDSLELCGDLRRDDAHFLFDQVESIRPFDLIFKREMHEGHAYPERIVSYPLTFGGKLSVRPAFKKYDVAFWGVESTPMRTAALTQLEPLFDCHRNGTRRGYSLSNYDRRGENYLDALSECKIALNFRGVGDDTLRFWEILAVGSFLLTERPRLNLSKPFVDHKHLVYFDDLGDLLEKCTYYLKHDEERETIARLGHEHFLQNHTLEHRVKFLLESIASLKEQPIKVYPSRSETRALMSNESQAIGIKYPQKDELKRICLIMFGLLGDVLIRTPLLRELRTLYPDAEITAFVDQSGRDALSLSRLVDKVVVVNRSKRFARIDVLSKLRFFAKIRFGSFDLVIDLYMGRSSQLLTKCSGAAYQIFAGVEVTRFKNGKNTYVNSKNFNFLNPHHLGCQFLRALFFLTPDRPNLCTRPEVDVGRLQFDANKSTTNRDFINKSYFLVSIGAGDKRKIPELNTLAKLCLVIYEEKGLKPLIIKNPGMEYLQQSFSNELTSLGVPFRKADFLDLKAIAALMLSVRFVIVPDTGLLHLAIGLRVTIMAFFPYTNPELVRPDAENYISIFEPDTSSKPIPGLLPYGIGTPSIDNLLRMTLSFRNQI